MKLIQSELVEHIMKLLPSKIMLPNLAFPYDNIRCTTCDHALIGLSNQGLLYTLHINWCRLHFTSLMEHTMVIELKPPLTCVFVRERSRCVCVCVRLRVLQLFLIRSFGKKCEGYMQYYRIFNVRILFLRFWIEVRLKSCPCCLCVWEESHFKRVMLHVISLERHLPKWQSCLRTFG